MTGKDLISTLKRKFKTKQDRSLASRIGIAVPTIQLWKKRTKVTARQVTELVHKASLAGARNMRARALRPVVEFFRIERTESKRGSQYEILTTKADNGDKHMYLDGLRRELCESRGIYIFFDSRGCALYVGKARKQTLWKETNNAYNRGRKDLQTIRRVPHPTRNQPYATSEERSRQIRHQQVSLHELAKYFSAYEVDIELIDEIEAVLVRSFANDLLNKRMERFGQQRRASAV
jgi:hypothetical protein